MYFITVNKYRFWISVIGYINMQIIGIGYKNQYRSITSQIAHRQNITYYISHTLTYTHTHTHTIWRVWKQCCRTCRRPSSVLCMVTHLLGWAPLVVMAVISESSSSFFSFSFFTRLSMARLANVSLSPPCLWHIRLCTMLRQASLLVGVFVMDILRWLSAPERLLCAVSNSFQQNTGASERSIQTAPAEELRLIMLTSDWGVSLDHIACFYRNKIVDTLWKPVSAPTG